MQKKYFIVFPNQRKQLKFISTTHGKNDSIKESDNSDNSNISDNDNNSNMK